MVVLVVVLGAGVAVAQQQTPAPGPTPGQQHMQGGMCPMMGGMMGGEADARTVQMRGEMMKAMGEVMMKYGKMMEGAAK